MFFDCEGSCKKDFLCRNNSLVTKLKTIIKNREIMDNFIQSLNKIKFKNKTQKIKLLKFSIFSKGFAQVRI